MDFNGASDGDDDGVVLADAVCEDGDFGEVEEEAKDEEEGDDDGGNDDVVEDDDGLFGD